MKRKTIALLALAVWCLLFLRCETTEKSMIRAVCLSRQGDRWEAAFLYQNPEAAADASEADAALRLCTAEGENLPAALSAAEAVLPQKADYRLCDYLIFPSDSGAELLSAYESLVLERQCGRTAAKMICTDFALDELDDAAKENETLADKLLEKLKAAAPLMPRLYQQDETILLPVLQLTETDVTCTHTAQLRTGSKVRELDAAQTEMYRLLSGTGGVRSFWLDGQQVQIRRCSVSVTLRAENVLLRLDCQRSYGMPQPDASACQQLEALCIRTVRELWEQDGVDVLHLQQRSAMQKADAEGPDPTKNACPQLQADVCFMQF